MTVEGKAVCVLGGGEGTGDGRERGERLPRAESADSKARFRMVKGRFNGAGAALSLHSSSAPLPHPAHHQMMRGSILTKPRGVLPRSFHAATSPFSGISASPPPSAGSDPPKGRLPSPRSESPPGARLDWAGARRSSAQLENPCSYI